MQADLQAEFNGNLEDILDYYETWFSRPQVEKLAEINDVDIDENSIRGDCETLYEEGSLEEFHEYVAALDGIGPSTIIEGIKLVN